MISDTLQAMMAGYVVKTAMHAVLGLYMWYWNRRWNKQAKANGTEIPEDERRKRAEEVGMVSACIKQSMIGIDYGADLPQTDATEFREFPSPFVHFSRITLTRHGRKPLLQIRSIE